MRVSYDTEHGKVYHAAHEEVLPTLADNSLDGCVTDGPYAIDVLGTSWDQQDTRRHKQGYEDMSKAQQLCHRMANGVNIRGDVNDWFAFLQFNLTWAEQVYRAMKPGAWGIAFGDGKTYDGLMVALRFAGFVIKDTIPWIYTKRNQPHGSKIDFLIDKKLGVERKIVGTKKQGGAKNTMVTDLSTPKHQGGFNDPDRTEYAVTEATSEEAKQWTGYHTGLARACDLLCLFQKPYEGTLAENAIKWGTSGINVEAARHEGGTWPANVWTGDYAMGDVAKFFKINASEEDDFEAIEVQGGGYFLVPKADWAEKEEGLQDLPVVNVQGGKPRRNSHPTPKSIALMRQCVRLIKPPTPKPIILDHHFGTGSTGVACYKEGAYFIGVENDAEYNYEAIYLAKLRHHIK